MPKPAVKPKPPVKRGQNMARCIVCNGDVNKDSERGIASRFTATYGIEILHPDCAAQLPEAPAQWGWRYPAGSLEAVPNQS